MMQGYRGTNEQWQIWIDTGGTFTDCIAQSPTGEIKRIKVLSNSRLRGRLIEKIASQKYRFTQQWRIDQDIFKGYDFFVLGSNEATAKIISVDFQQGILELDADLGFTKAIDFEITAHEEAPILAARLATKTVLQKKLPPIAMRLGSTKGTNALLEKKGAKTVLLVTKGFRDLLYIGTQQRPHLFQLDIPEPELLYDSVFEVAERLDAQGNILLALAEPEIQRIITQLKKLQPESIAIAFLHAYRNPVHEQQLAEALRQAGFSFISQSQELTPSIKILPRAQTALVNAYLLPIIRAYLQKIHAKLPSESSQLLVMTSAGGLVAADLFHPKDSLLSGPAGGVVGASRIAKTLGFEQVLTFDMGGTSTDAARIANGYDYRYLTKVGSAEMLSPSLAIETVAAGGGSICYFDGHKLNVGPESAGASPGPACYGAGGPLTITDVNLLLGKLEPSAMGIPIHAEKARSALRQIQTEIEKKTTTKYSKIELLRGFEAIANEKMADAIRKISVAKGFDPKDYKLLAFGGAGGLHACRIADLLRIDQVILPYDGGLLSAYGIGHARVERLAEQQILQLLDDCEHRLPQIMDELSEQALAKLQQAGYPTEALEIVHQFVYLRFKGQDSALELPFTFVGKLLPDFEKQYSQLFGHYPEGRAVEVESVKVMVGTKLPPISVENKIATLKPARLFDKHSSDFTEKSIAVYRWDDLEVGNQIEGPAILLNSNSTAFIEADWEATVHVDKNIVAQPLHSQQSDQFTAKEAIELELFTNRFAAIADEMGAQLQRTAFSVNVKERLDFSCALLDADAELLVNAPHIPVHLGSLGICARLVRERIHLGKGDVVITNHPKYGGSHLPDVTLLSAVYTDAHELIGYVINRAHHAEIGGKRPGSMPPDAKNLAEEGVVILPMYLVKNGEARWAEMEDLLRNAAYPTRALAENLADMNAALASLRSGELAMQQLVRTHGSTKVQHYMQQLKVTSQVALQNALQVFENEVFAATERLDDGHTIQVKISIKEGKIDFDFMGTSGVHPGNLNANISIVFSAIIYVLRLLCGKDIPLNEGLMQNVQIHLPNSFLHPKFDDEPSNCPAVVGGNTEVSQRLVDTLLKALNMVACSQGTMNNFLFGNEKFGYYETICGGAGAGEGWHGRSAVHQHMTNTRITDTEEMELRYPVRLWEFAVRQNSGGEGHWRGGDGIIRELEFLENLDITILSQHRTEAPYGLAGGEAGKTGEQVLYKKNGASEKLAGVDTRSVVAGDRIIIKTPGGGGFEAADSTDEPLHR